jgi:hypothetical protein
MGLLGGNGGMAQALTARKQKMKERRRVFFMAYLKML